MLFAMDELSTGARRTLPEALRSGAPLLGVLVSVRSPEVAEALALTGVDWLFVDLEHSLIDVAAAQAILQAVAGRAFTVLRVVANAPEHFKRALDTGCDGVMVPMVRTVAEARAAVLAARYPPLGERSVGIGRAHGYGLRFAAYTSEANARTALILQVEHIDAVEAIAELVAIKGVDAIFLGPYDLSGSMGLLGQVNHPKVVSAMDQVRAACTAAGLPLGIFCATTEQAEVELGRGATLVVAGTDLGLMTGAATSSLQRLRGSAPTF
jgi:2-keto-3-deoxy-L-rhamnonate aldolase RhmA